MKSLSQRQQQLIDLIRDHVRTHGAPPTRAELARQMGVRAVSTVEQHLQALARKGYLDILPGVNRNIRLLDAVPTDAGLPLVGRVAAGAPMLASQHLEGHYRIDRDLFKPRADYLLRVSGMSMRDAGILDGDLLAVHRTSEVHNGQIVVARLADEVTVKRFQRRSGRIRLIPENPEFQPLDIEPHREQLVIEGVAVGIIRNGRF